MAHLDSEFQKQPNPALKSLIADQVRRRAALTGPVADTLSVPRKASLHNRLFEMSQSFRARERISGTRVDSHGKLCMLLILITPV